jgi:hypothetical protein
MTSQTITDQQKELKEALAIEKDLAFLKSVTEQDRNTIIQKRKKLAEKLKTIASGEFNDWSVCAQIMLHDQDLQNLGIMAGGMVPKRTICNFLTDPANQEKLLICYWQNRLGLYRDIISTASKEDEKPYLSHARRRQGFSVAIHGLEKAIDQINASEALKQHAVVSDARYELARAYFSRGRIVRPKGFSIPGKKKELFQRALDQLSKVQQKSEELPADDSETLLLKAQIYLEWLRFFPQEPPADLDQTLSYAYQTAKDQLKDSLLIAIAERAASKTSTETLDKWMKTDLTELMNADDNPKDENSSFILRARAATVLRRWDIVETLMPGIIKSLEKKAFFDEDWERVVQLLKDTHHQLEKEMDNIKSFPEREWNILLECFDIEFSMNYFFGFPKWTKYCRNLWELTQRQELKETGGCHLRWYWSRQRDVYDLAFEAAGDDFALKARIADSLKSRPALHFSQLEKMGEDGDETIKQWVEQQAAGLLNHYIPNLTPSPPSIASQKDEVSWAELPENWIAVHFYLGQGACSETKKGYALIQRGENWTQKPFDYGNLWAVYLAWQHAYAKCSHLEIENQQAYMPPILEIVCREIGKEMPWLFDAEIFPPDCPVVLIPHDFLHRLPLHCALNPFVENEREKLFLSLHLAITLPAWWLVDEKRETYSYESAPTTSNKLFLVHWDNMSEKLTNLIDAISKYPGMTINKEAEPMDLLETGTPPQLLVIYSHGEAQQGNPYGSRLKLKQKDLSVGEILGSGTICLNGSDVYLGACEADLMLPLTSPLDEHITLSSAFLEKGAAKIAAPLWRIHQNSDIDFFGPCLQNHKTLHEQWLSWYDAYIGDYENDPRNPNNLHSLYKVSAMRVIGRPWSWEDNN